MSKPWMPFYVGDFLADTMHLGATETGIYLRLIMHCWQHGSIPLDDRKLAIIGHCDIRLWHQYRKTVLQFFDVVDASTAQHKRVSTELQRYAAVSKRKTKAEKRVIENTGENGVTAQQKCDVVDASTVQHRSSTLFNENNGSFENLQTQSQSQSPKKKKEPVLRTGRARSETPLPEGWKPSEADRAYARSKDWDEARIDRQAERFVNHALAKDRRLRDWAAGWRNWVTSQFQEPSYGRGMETAKPTITAVNDRRIAELERERARSEESGQGSARLLPFR
jgi:uncharacterized protein YdaU (DUF1376 family)